MNLTEYTQSLIEQSEQLRSARHEKWQGEWNHSDYDRHAMAAEEKLLVKIANELRKIQSSNQTARNDM